MKVLNIINTVLISIILALQIANSIKISIVEHSLESVWSAARNCDVELSEITSELAGIQLELSRTQQADITPDSIYSYSSNLDKILAEASAKQYTPPTNNYKDMHNWLRTGDNAKSLIAKMRLKYPTEPSPIDLPDKRTEIESLYYRAAKNNVKDAAMILDAAFITGDAPFPERKEK